MMQPQSFIVFGVTGFIGRAIQTALERRGAGYVGFGSNACIHRTTANRKESTEARTPADRAAELARVPPPTAVIFAAGAALATSDPETLRKSHLGSLRAAFEALPPKWHDGLRFVYASSGLVYGRHGFVRPLTESDPAAPNSIYGEIKLRCEELLAELAARSGARAVAARLFNVTGSGQADGIVADIARQAVDIRSGIRTDFCLRSNTPILDLVDVEEAAEGLVRLAEASPPPPVVNVCSGRPLTTDHLINAARHVIGREAPVSYQDDRGPCEALIGNPDLMAATTGWRARKTLDRIVADVIMSRQGQAGIGHG
jgi:nucleoside-diphosphate-sugar epimerase